MPAIARSGRYATHRYEPIRHDAVNPNDRGGNVYQGKIPGISVGYAFETEMCAE